MPWWLTLWTVSLGLTWRSAVSSTYISTGNSFLCLYKIYTRIHNTLRSWTRLELNQQPHKPAPSTTVPQAVPSHTLGRVKKSTRRWGSLTERHWSSLDTTHSLFICLYSISTTSQPCETVFCVCVFLCPCMVNYKIVIYVILFQIIFNANCSLVHSEQHILCWPTFISRSIFDQSAAVNNCK